MNIVILGAPASGKGTQAQLLSEKLNLFHFQAGELSRSLAKRDERIREIVNSGGLIPEEEMTMYVLDYLEKLKPDFKNIIFEGFPRFISQYEALDNFLKVKNCRIDHVIVLEISEERAIERLSARRLCEKCGKVYNLLTNPPERENVCVCGGKLIQREDDKPELLRVRFRFYKKTTKKLVDYLEKKGILLRIDAARPIEIIFEDILNKLKIEH